MKKIIYILLLTSCITLFSRDWEISKGEIVFDVSQGYSSYNFEYDSNGKKKKFDFSVSSIETLCTVEYGISDRFLIGSLINYGDFDFSEEASGGDEEGDDFEGFHQREVYIDYVSKYGPGFSLGVILPYGMKELPGTDSDPEYEFGLVFRPGTKFFRLDSGVSYVLTVKGQDDKKQDKINFVLLPQIKINNVCTFSAGIWGSYNFYKYKEGSIIEDSEGYIVYGDLGISYLSNDNFELGFSYEFSFLGNDYLPAGAGFNLNLTCYL